MMRQMLMLFGVLALLFVAACSDQTVEPARNDTNTTNSVQCTDPRPEACTREYMPVCGDNSQTYGNKCEACANQDVNSYVPGACAGSEKLFEIRYAGAFTVPEWAQTVYSVTGKTFTVTRMTNDNEVTYSESKELSAEELGELQDIIANINDLEANYTTDELVTDVGYAEISVGGEQTRIEQNIEEAYPAELLALRNWAIAQSEMLPDEQGRIYQSRDPDVCMRIKYMCVEGMVAFSDDTGCGCQAQNPSGGTHLALTECKEPRPEMCTQQYDPVCAQVDTGVRCITTPCASTVYKTLGNSCSACSDEKVYGYFPGECGDLEGKSPEDLAAS